MKQCQSSYDSAEVEEEPYYCSPVCAPDDILCSGSDAEDTPDEVHKKHLRYEAAAQRVATGHLPAILSARLKGPFSKEGGWINPWRYRPKKKQDDAWWQPGSEDMLFTRANVMKRAAAHGLGYLTPADALRWCKDTAKAEADAIIETNIASGALVRSVERDEFNDDEEGEENLPAIDNRHQVSTKHRPKSSGPASSATHDLSMLNNFGKTPHTDEVLEANTKLMKRAADSQWLKGSYVSKRARWEGAAVDSPTPLPDVLDRNRRRRQLPTKVPGLGGVGAHCPSRFSAGSPGIPQGARKPQLPTHQTPQQATGSKVRADHEPVAIFGLANRSSQLGQLDFDSQEDDIDELQSISQENDHRTTSRGSSIKARKTSRNLGDRSFSDLEPDDLIAITPGTKQSHRMQSNTLQRSHTSSSRPYELPTLPRRKPRPDLNRSSHEEEGSFVTEVAPSSRNLEKFQFRRRTRYTQQPKSEATTRDSIKIEDDESVASGESTQQAHEAQNILSKPMELPEIPYTHPVLPVQHPLGLAEVPPILGKSDSQTTPPRSDKSLSWDKNHNGQAPSLSQAAESSHPQSPPKSNASAIDTPVPKPKRAGPPRSPSVQNDNLTTPLQDHTIAMDFVLGLPDIPPASPWKMPGFDDFNLSQRFRMSLQGSPKPTPQKRPERAQKLLGINGLAKSPPPIRHIPRNPPEESPRLQAITKLAESSQNMYDFSTQSYNTTPPGSLPAAGQTPTCPLIGLDTRETENTTGIEDVSTDEMARIQIELSQICSSSSHGGGPHSSPRQASQDCPHEYSVVVEQPSRPQSDIIQGSTPTGRAGSQSKEQSSVEINTAGPVLETTKIVTAGYAMSSVESDGEKFHSSSVLVPLAGEDTITPPELASKADVEIPELSDHIQVESDAAALPDESPDRDADGQERNEPSADFVQPEPDVNEHQTRQFAVDMEPELDVNGGAGQPISGASPRSESSWEGCSPQSPWAAEGLKALSMNSVEQPDQDMTFQAHEGYSQEASVARSVATSDRETLASGWEHIQRPRTPRRDSTVSSQSDNSKAWEITERPQTPDDSGITPFETFASPARSPERSTADPGNNDLMNTQTIVEAALKNPWTSVTKNTSVAKAKKRVSFGVLEEEEDPTEHEQTRFAVRFSPPPQAAHDQHDEEDIFHDGTVITNTFRKHFVAVTRPGVFKRILPEHKASQPTSSPGPEAQAEAFLAADHNLSEGRSWSITSKRVSSHYLETRGDSNSNIWNECEKDDPMLMNPFAMTPKVRSTNSASSFNMDDVLGAAADFLGDWSVDSELKKAKEPQEEARREPRMRGSTGTGHRRRKLFGLV
ncbi:uncharacterized protein L3040_001552 [Drepanopeziza brunnea f. sp. 'multigermtubi']|uniref:Protamine P1 n=1 Tax=Marssonina brunnea f. sp. multigermtubi (strain MB_m1) TaxID=1072389 RepID=K1XRH2_MARBU|nr:protamine P1 [Drepanopeziza brunnea f. sp. 'multigermtubi' MB_m1]EKD15184.1 protamine P1 [Drepanopeziza brunnea f. sp. 'multigermtubi' MB_m1]KAJ5051781.1 hypothetical protein L3040_001552 [Drepanopeziza brunnea f. sp. 'multigermtubi']